MRILQVTTSARRRGAEVFADQLAQALRVRGHEVSTAHIESGEQDQLDFDRLGRGRRDPRSWTELLRRIRKCDVAIAHGGSTLLPVATCAEAARTPFVYRNIGDPAHWGKARGASLRVGAPLRRAARVVALYDGAARYMIGRYGLAPRALEVIPNAVDTGRFPRRTDTARTEARRDLGLEDAQLVLGYLGSLSSEKRPEWCLDVAEAIDDSVLLIAGDGPLAEQLQRRAAALQSTSGPRRCALVGAVRDPARFLCAIDVLLLPSRTEGIPGVLLEAALVGVPTVATDVGGVRETMATAGGGLVVPVDDRDSFIAAARRVGNNPETCLPDRAAVAEQHGMERIAARWETLLEGVVHGRPTID